MAQYQNLEVADSAKPLRENMLCRPRVRPVPGGRSQVVAAKMQSLITMSGI